MAYYALYFGKLGMEGREPERPNGLIIPEEGKREDRSGYDMAFNSAQEVPIAPM
jgi:hypothetical protein